MRPCLSPSQDAHGVMLNLHQALAAAGQALPAEHACALVLLHSYLLVRARVRLGDHTVRSHPACRSGHAHTRRWRAAARRLCSRRQGAARLLLRVAADMQLFATHTVAILTSAVIECARGGLPGHAHRLAARLMQPASAAQVQPQYRQKLAALLARPALSRCASHGSGLGLNSLKGFSRA